MYFAYSKVMILAELWYYAGVNIREKQVFSHGQEKTD
jgi:hypothetical protein